MRTVLSRDGLTVADVACRRDLGHGQPAEYTGGRTLVFVRRGWFRRSANGVEALLDPTVAYCINPAEEERCDHPHGDGDDCTALGLDPTLVASLLGGEPALPTGALPTTWRVDLEHRSLLAQARGSDPDELFERAIELAACVLEQLDPRRVAAGRPATAGARRMLADGARAALAADPLRSLPDLACALSVSPHHLSRVFHSISGHTISRHRIRLRVRAALDRLGDGEPDIARLAVELGFADQSHFSRAIRSETGQTPSALRRLLAMKRGK